MKYEDGEAYDLKTRGPYFDIWFEMIEHYLDSFLPEAGLLLDAGGGTGEFSIRAARLRENLICENLDISQPMLDQAERKLKEKGLQDRIRNRHGDIQNLPYRSVLFDYVMCLGDAISFCPDHELAFKELVRVTKPNGQIHLSVNSFWGNYHAMYTEKGRELGVSFDDAGMYMKTRVLQMNGQSTGCRSFTLKELMAWAEQHDLAVVKKFAAPVFPASPQWFEDAGTFAAVKQLQYSYCEEESIMEFGNHLNVIYRKER
jgi:ubiquinone/menaquinone biosynthesis C-methylase UbiE